MRQFSCTKHRLLTWYFFAVNFLLLTFGFSSVHAQTVIRKTTNGYQLVRDGKPYEVKGVGGQVNLESAVSIGANSIRTWGIEDAQQVLDEAQRLGLTVMLGFWLQHERHGFDYNDTVKVKKQLEHFKAAVDRFKNHPALLFWGIGNEVDLNYSNTNVWYAVQDIAEYIHQTDPHHPTSTVTAGLDSQEVRLIKERCPDIDIYCVNTYGDIAGVPENIVRYGWDGPYMITEWGPNGYWEAPKTSWNVSIEQTSSEKKQVYFDRFEKYIRPNSDRCLGSYAFLWGAKQEYTETWFGLFSKDNKPTEPIDALEMVFTGKYPSMGAPTILAFDLDGKKPSDNIHLKAGER
ncbi:MAG: glycoside hydrolase family 2 TIM barrel-domain containing protein, partial [Bacteroidota bacterium]